MNIIPCSCLFCCVNIALSANDGVKEQSRIHVRLQAGGSNRDCQGRPAPGQPEPLADHSPPCIANFPGIRLVDSEFSLNLPLVYLSTVRLTEKYRRVQETKRGLHKGDVWKEDRGYKGLHELFSELCPVHFRIAICIPIPYVWNLGGILLVAK